MEKEYSALLSFTEEDTTVYWIFECTQEEFKKLEREVEVYNGWIDKLLVGEAPLSSYKYPNDADEFYLKNNINPKFKHIHTSHVFDAVYLHQGGIGDIEDEVVYKKFKNNKLRVGNYPRLIEILTQPFDHTEFKMGFRVLPTTKRLLDSAFEKLFFCGAFLLKGYNGINNEDDTHARAVIELYKNQIK